MSAIDRTDRRRRLSKCHHASALQPTSKNRDSIANMAESAIWFDIGNRKRNVEYRRGQTGREIRAAQPEGERGKKTVSKKGPPESPAPVQLQSPDQDQPLQPQPVHAESPKVDEPPAIDEPVDAVAASPEPPATTRRCAASPEPPPARALASRAREPATAEPAAVEPVAAESHGRTCNGRTCDGRTRTGDLADHHERLSRLHQEIIRGFRVVFRAAQRRSVARQGDVCSHRICEAGLRDLRCRVAEDLRTPQQACQANPRAPSRFGRQGAGNARQVLRRCASLALAQSHENKRLRFSGAFLRYREW